VGLNYLGPLAGHVLAREEKTEPPRGFYSLEHAPGCGACGL